MGMSKLVCYCIAPVDICKSGVRSDGSSCFDHEHWAETRVNLERYLSEDVCVPHASSVEKVLPNFHEALTGFLGAFEHRRAVLTSGFAHSSSTLMQVHEAYSNILKLALDAVTNRQVNSNDLIAAPLPPISEDDRCMSMARLLAISAHRAMHELIESIHQESEFYIHHHHAVLLDISLEMARLVNEGWEFGAERFLEENHPHVQSINLLHGPSLEAAE